MDSLIEKQYGQDVIDSLSVLDAVVPTFHEELWSKSYELFPMIGLALRSRFAIIRQCAAKCLATIGDVMTVAAMRYVIETIVPVLGDTLNLCYRQGATELVYRERCTVSYLLNLALMPPFRHRSEARHQSSTVRDLHDRAGPRANE